MGRIEAYTGDDPYIFISYSHKDTEVSALLTKLADKNYRFWYDEGIKSGLNWADEIAKRIKNCTQFIAILSNNAIKSENVKDEIHLAVKHKIDMLIVHLENIILDGGLELQLDRKQALLKYAYDTSQDFEKALVQAISNKTIKPFDNEMAIARKQLEEQYELLGLMSSSNTSKCYFAMKRSTAGVAIVNHTLKPKYGTAVVLPKKHVLNLLCSCPFVPSLLDVFEDEKNTFTVTSYYDGQLLSSMLKEIDRTNVAAHQVFCVKVTISIAEGLEYLHEANTPIVHRNIKPDNIVVTTMGHAIIEGLDICKAIDNFEYTVLGTYGYAPPEQYNGLEDCRADIFSLGVTFLEMLTGCKPTDHSTFDIKRPLRSYDSRFSPALEQIILKMTALDVENRYKRINEVIADLKDYKILDSKSQCLKESNKRLSDYKKKWSSFVKLLDKKHPELVSIVKKPIQLYSHGSASATLELSPKFIEEQGFWHYVGDETRAVFSPSTAIKHIGPLTLNFEISEVHNVEYLKISINRIFKCVEVTDNHLCVLFDDMPTLIDLSHDNSLMKIDQIVFECHSGYLIDNEKFAKLVITNVTIAKA